MMHVKDEMMNDKTVYIKFKNYKAVKRKCAAVSTWKVKAVKNKCTVSEKKDKSVNED